MKPQGTINLAVYEDNKEFEGIAKVTLPDISYLNATMSGAGIGGNILAVFTGMVDAMTTTINFLSATEAAVNLMSPKKHQLDMRIAEEYWDATNAEKGVWADKYVLVVVPTKMSPGEAAPASAVSASGEYAVSYYAAYKDGEQLWEIDPYAMRCYINGTDYMEPVRKALGK